MNPNVRSINYGVLFFIYLSTFILTRNCCGCLLLTQAFRRIGRAAHVTDTWIFRTETRLSFSVQDFRIALWFGLIEQRLIHSISSTLVCLLSGHIPSQPSCQFLRRSPLAAAGRSSAHPPLLCASLPRHTCLSGHGDGSPPRRRLLPLSTPRSARLLTRSAH